MVSTMEKPTFDADQSIVIAKNANLDKEKYILLQRIERIERNPESAKSWGNVRRSITIE